MGCSQSANKPVARPDATASASETNDMQAQAPVQTGEVKVNVDGTTQAAGAAVSTTNGSSANGSGPKQHRPLVVCGPSGVGKGTLLTRLLKEYPHVFAKSVSHTTRQPRAGEVDGKSYHFTQVADLLAAVEAGQFIEHANVHGNYYGTSISSVAAVRDSGRICLLEIDIQGVLSVKRVESLNPVTVFVRAPTFQDLIDRLTGRGSENEETMQKRLDTARGEMDFFYTNRHIFEADLINEKFEVSYAQLLATIQRLYPEVKLENPVVQAPTPAAVAQ